MKCNKAFFEKSVVDGKSCLHYLLPPPRPDSVHRDIENGSRKVMFKSRGSVIK